MSYDALNGVIVFRLKKSKNKIATVFDDLKNLREKVKTKEILESQVVIYLAALAVKHVTLTDLSFEDAYNEIIRTYEKIRLKTWINGQMDRLTKYYLEVKLKGDLIGFENKYIDTLNDHNLIVGTRLKTLDEIEIGGKTKNTILNDAVCIYNEFKYNRKTRVHFERDKKESLVAFYSIVGGFQLNTVQNRSHSGETKVARLVLAKAD